MVGGLFTSFNVSADAYQRVIVEVQGRPVILPESSETVAGALSAARRPLRAGALRAARVLGWTVDSSDYLEPPPDVIVARMMARVRPGGGGAHARRRR